MHAACAGMRTGSVSQTLQCAACIWGHEQDLIQAELGIMGSAVMHVPGCACGVWLMACKQKGIDAKKIIQTDPGTS